MAIDLGLTGFRLRGVLVSPIASVMVSREDYWYRGAVPFVGSTGSTASSASFTLAAKTATASAGVSSGPMDLGRFSIWYLAQPLAPVGSLSTDRIDYWFRQSIPFVGRIDTPVVDTARYAGAITLGAKTTSASATHYAPAPATSARTLVSHTVTASASLSSGPMDRGAFRNWYLNVLVTPVGSLSTTRDDYWFRNALPLVGRIDSVIVESTRLFGAITLAPKTASASAATYASTTATHARTLAAKTASATGTLSVGPADHGNSARWYNGAIVTPVAGMNLARDDYWFRNRIVFVGRVDPPMVYPTATASSTLAAKVASASADVSNPAAGSVALAADVVTAAASFRATATASPALAAHSATASASATSSASATATLAADTATASASVATTGTSAPTLASATTYSIAVSTGFGIEYGQLNYWYRGRATLVPIFSKTPSTEDYWLRTKRVFLGFVGNTSASAPVPLATLGVSSSVFSATTPSAAFVAGTHQISASASVAISSTASAALSATTAASSAAYAAAAAPAVTMASMAQSGAGSFSAPVSAVVPLAPTTAAATGTYTAVASAARTLASLTVVATEDASLPFQCTAQAFVDSAPLTPASVASFATPVASSLSLAGLLVAAPGRYYVTAASSTPLSPASAVGVVAIDCYANGWLELAPDTAVGVAVPIVIRTYFPDSYGAVAAVNGANPWATTTRGGPSYWHKGNR